jgi:anti-sigma28 factor (negative regulator of flagellin synthesis)
MQIYGPAHVHGAQPINPPHRLPASSPAAPSDATAGMDQLEISREAELLSRFREIPGIRADRVAQIRAAIEAGTYETDDKLEVALGRLLEGIAG